MNPFRQIPFRLRDVALGRKLLWVTGMSTAVGAFAAGIALYWYQAGSLREEFRSQITMLTNLVASYASAPIAFGDRDGARDTLERMRANPNITAAELRLPNGMIFARFGSVAGESEILALPVSSGFDGSWLHAFCPVVLEDRTLATLHVVASFEPVRRASLNRFIVPLAGIALIGFAMTTLTALGLRGSIVGPVQRLAQLAQRIAVERDYSLRATLESRDEVGQLTEAVNTMLQRIETADHELRAAYARLENETRERNRLNADLVKASRLAGMTEVATGVLHNVGNVLNTVNLAVHGMRERLEQARFRHLRQVVALIESEQARLAQFLTEDPRGRALPGFLSQLTSHFEAENGALLEEVTRLIDKVDHIKEIVSTQQSHARIIGVTEQVGAAELAEDAIKMAMDSLQRHRISLRRDMRPAAAVLIDRHKVVQILVNLLNNAKDSIVDGGAAERRIELCVAPVGSTHVGISVADTGAGIAPENLPCIFRHGFTTKADGHGFGLHMSALAAQEMRGALRVHSEGLGRGARFTLELPLAANTSIT